ncbi:hypothetical protein LguiB_009623 [Lonicera macranthoides]
MDSRALNAVGMHLMRLREPQWRLVELVVVSHAACTCSDTVVDERTSELIRRAPVL